MLDTKEKYVLLIDCPDTIGIVKTVSSFFYEIGAGIISSDQHSDLDSERFFARWEIKGFQKPLPPFEELKAAFVPIAEQFDMRWNFLDANIKPKIVVAVSKTGHCLHDLLYQWHAGILPADIAAVISNHDDFRKQVEWYELPYYHLPITKDTKREQEQKILDVMTETEAELLVLARYMQILTPEMCEKLSGRAINIHHSFLPSFKGANPYRQAFDRGVKITGATAHYVTTDLDEGPIIEQDVQRVSHYHSNEELVRMGADIEQRVLTRAVSWHCSNRIVLNGQKTIVFR